MKLKKVVALLTATILAFGLVACGSDKSGGGSESGKDSEFDWTAGADASGGEVTLRVATWREYDREYYEEIVRRFEEKYDWIHVELEITPDSGSYYSNLNADLISGIAPDVFDCHPSGDIVVYAEEGQIAPQTDFDYVQNYSDEAKGITTFFGENYGYMNAYNYFGFLYNKEIFAKMGLSVPSTPEELVNVVNTLKQAGYGGIAYAGGTNGSLGLWNPTLLICLGMEGYDNLRDGIDNGSITDISTVEGVPEALKTLQYYKENDIYYTSYESITYEAARSLYVQEKTAIYYGGSYLFGEKGHFGDLETGFFAVPTYANNGLSYAEGAQTTLINAASKNLGAAKLWVEHLASAEIAEYYCESATMMSTIKGVAPETDILTMLKECCKGYAIQSIVEPENEEYWSGAFQKLRDGIIYNGDDWQDAVAKFTAKLEDYDLKSLK